MSLLVVLQNDSLSEREFLLVESYDAIGVPLPPFLILLVANFDLKLLSSFTYAKLYPCTSLFLRFYYLFSAIYLFLYTKSSLF